MSSIKLVTNLHNWAELNLDDLAEFSFKARQSRPETFNNKRTLERERRIINLQKQFSPSFVVVTSKGNKMLGWLSFDLESPNKVEIGRWLPAVLEGEEEDEVLAALIEASKDYCRKIHYSRLEVSFNIRDQGERQAYKIYRRWYEAHNVRIKDEVIYMFRNLSENDNTGISTPEAFETKSISEINDDELYLCYHEAFTKSKNRIFQDQTESERRDYFFDYYSKSKPFIKEASLVLKKLKKRAIIGVTVVRPRGGDAHLSLLAIHPDYQRRGLGKFLLKLVIKRVFKQGFKSISLGVDIENPAIILYQKVGFVSTSHIITHSWKTK
ncbi:MAG: GNAT family N-acetyltransferase [Promethearchaeota archaeon]